MQIKKIFTIVFILVLTGINPARAAGDARTQELTQKVLATQNAEFAYPFFEELTELYFSGRQYNEYADFLKNLAQKKKEFEPAADYYTALTRYYQLKHLEDSQSWDEYFSKGNDYRGSIKDSLGKAIQASGENADVYGLNARLLQWKFLKAQHDDGANAALADLMNYLSRYASVSGANPQAIKECGYELLSYDEKIKAKLAYEIYAEKLVSSGASQDDLNKTALGLYNEGNLGLAESIYNLYIERAIKELPPEKSAVILLDIGKLFLYGKQKPYDAFYAEAVLSRARKIGGADIFDEGLTYQRAVSLEKTKQYESAKGAYDELVARFPSSARANEAQFKSAFISIYGLGDVKGGKAGFERLAAAGNPDAYTIAGIYQLGLLHQWENDLEGAKKYYEQTVSSGAAERDSDILVMARQRLNEISTCHPMEHNLKMFLDTAIKSGGPSAGLGLSADSYLTDTSEAVSINSSALPLESGCVQVSMEYLWSGPFTGSVPPPASPSFNTSFESRGPKVIGVVAVTPAGTAGWDFVIIDVR